MLILLKGDIKLNAKLVEQIIHNLYKSRLIEGRNFSYSFVNINDVRIEFDDFWIVEECNLLCFDFNDNQTVSINLNDIYKIN